MTPYYDDGTVVLYLGDCREVLSALDVPAATVITDPPYGETSLIWDRWPTGWVDSLPTNSVQLWCFGSLRMLMANLHDFDGWTYSQEIVWRKQNGSGLHTRRFRRAHEFAFHWYRGPWGRLTLNQQYTLDATARTVRKRQRPTHWGEIDQVEPYRSVDGGPRQMTCQEVLAG